VTLIQPTYVHALGTEVPTAALTLDRAAAVLRNLCPDERTARLVAKLLPHTGIIKRHFAAMETQSTFDDPSGLYQPASAQPAGPGTNARSLAFAGAADRLVGRLLAPLRVDDLAAVGALITVSCTHASSPGLEQAVFKHSPVPHSVDRWNLGFMGCSAALAAMRLAAHSASSAPTMVLACELSSLHFQYSNDLDQLTANLLFADGAAAMILRRDVSPLRIQHAACWSLPQHADQMVWWAGDTGLRLTLSPELPHTLARYLPRSLERFLAGANLTTADIDHWLVHPGGPQILDAVETACGLSQDALRLSREILRSYGNMSSPTILFILRAAIEAGMTGRTVLLAFGPGLTIEAVVVDIADSAGRLLRGPAALSQQNVSGTGKTA
jgi:predicted naringenin-chalcone synthase